MELSPEVLAALQAKASGGVSTSSVVPSSNISSDVLSALKAKAGILAPKLTANQTSLGRLASVGQGGFGGFLDEAGAGVQSLGGYLGALSSGNPENLSLGDIYSENLAKNRAGYEQYQEADPMASTALNIGGSVLSPINKLAMGAKAPTLLKTAGASALQGGIYGAGQAEGNENLLKEVGQGALLSGGTTGVLGLAGKTVKGIASKAEDLAQATKNKLFGVQYSDIKKSLDKDVRALGDTEAPIQKALNKLAEQGAIKAGSASDNLLAVETQIGQLGKEVKSVLGKADAVQIDPLIPNYSTTEDFISKLDSDARTKAQEVYSRLKKSQSNNVLLSDWELEKSALSKAGASTYGMQGADALEANLKKYMAKDIKDAVDNELTKPLYKQALGADYQNVKELRSAMADRFRVQGALTKASAREASSDIVQKLKGLTRTTMGYGVPMLVGSSSAGPVGALLGMGAGAVLESNTGQKALVKALQGTNRLGQPIGEAIESLAPVAGQAVRQLNESEPAIVMPEAQTPVKKLGDLIAKDMTKKEDNKQVLLSSLVDSGITDPDEAKQFLAQMEHESGGFKSMVERGSGAKYEGRKDLGNTQKGDGERFKGRGFIQLTGRFNYDKYGKMLGIDLVNNPELAADPEVASKIAIAYWNDRVKPKVKDFKDIKAVTKIINGGYNGLDDRIARFKKYDNNEEILALLNDLASRKA